VTIKGFISFAAEKSRVRREVLEAAKIMKPGSELNLVSAFLDRCSKRRRTRTAEHATINVTASVAIGNVGLCSAAVTVLHDQGH
jgi:hypothetical protein